MRCSGISWFLISCVILSRLAKLLLGLGIRGCGYSLAMRLRNAILGGMAALVVLRVPMMPMTSVPHRHVVRTHEVRHNHAANTHSKVVDLVVPSAKCLA